MNTTYNKEDLLGHLNLLKPTGYNVDNDGHFIKEESGRRIDIYFSIREDFPFDATFSSIGVGISFAQVEQIFHQVWQNFPNLDFGHDLTSATFKTSFRDSIIGQSGHYFLLDNPVSDTASFNEAFPYLNQLMSTSVNFITQYTTLQDFYNYGESLATGRERASFYNQPLPARKMIIKKLLNISDYSTYATDVVNHYNQQPDVEEAAFLQALKNYLDTL